MCQTGVPSLPDPRHQGHCSPGGEQQRRTSVWTYDDGGYSFGVVSLTPSRGRQPVTWAITGMRMRRSASVLPLTLLCFWSHCLGLRRPSSDRQDLNPHFWQIVCCLDRVDRIYLLPATLSRTRLHCVPPFHSLVCHLAV